MDTTAARHCADGRCASSLPEVLAEDGTVLFAASATDPSFVHGEQLICNTCLLARLNLDSEVTYVDPHSIVEVIEIDAVERAFAAAGLPAGPVSDLDGSYHPEDHLSMVRYVDADAVAALARDLGAEQ